MAMIGGGDEDEGLKLKSSQARQKQPCDPTQPESHPAALSS